MTFHVGKLFFKMDTNNKINEINLLICLNRKLCQSDYANEDIVLIAVTLY